MTRVLVIDDDDAIREVMQRTLADAGYLVLCAADGSAGLRSFQEFLPDLVITDIIMPEREGIETIRAIRSLDAAVPIIAVSGGARIGSLDVLSLAEKFGANRVLVKPFFGSALLNTVREILASRRTAMVGVGAAAAGADRNL